VKEAGEISCRTGQGRAGPQCARGCLLISGLAGEFAVFERARAPRSLRVCVVASGDGEVSLSQRLASVARALRRMAGTSSFLQYDALETTRTAIRAVVSAKPLRANLIYAGEGSEARRRPVNSSSNRHLSLRWPLCPSR